MNCNICPRRCNVDRSVSHGACGFDDKCRVARMDLHMWEEPPICGTNGSGAIFFSGCNLRCVFCQNHSISRGMEGRIVSAYELADEMYRLRDMGAHNINLVSPTPHTEIIVQALEYVKSNGFSLPIVYNTNGYELVSTIKRLEGLVDIYLPDLKYVSSLISKRFSGAANYFEHAASAIVEMQRQVGVLKIKDGVAQRGLIVRHLVLPACIDETRAALDFLAVTLPKETYISLMSQYVPMADAVNMPPLNRKLKRREYERAVDYCRLLGFENVFLQDMSSANSNYTPDF